MNPITIVIPVYNRAHTLRRTLDSVAAQRVEPAAVVLVDNNSTDDSLEIMHEWVAKHRNVVVVRETKPGASNARNRGLQEVRTDFVMFFDSDDVMLPTHVEAFTQAIAANPDVDVFGRDIMVELYGGKKRRCYFSERDAMFHHIFRGNLGTARTVARASLVRRAGGWAGDIRVWDDYELGLRLMLQHPKVKALTGYSVETFFEQESLTGSFFSSKPGKWEEVLDRMEAHLSAIPSAKERRRYAEWLNGRRMILAAEYLNECQHSPEELHATAKSQSERLRRQVMASTTRPRSMRIIFSHMRRFKRLGWVVAKMLAI